MTLKTEQTEVGQQPGLCSHVKFFSYKDDTPNTFPSPWKAAFPKDGPLGYWQVFAKRCSNISHDAGGLVDEETAKMVWMGILSEYEDYEKMGMWLPHQVMEEHRQVASALGWYTKTNLEK